jgi:predicted metal-binding protein
MKGEKRQKMASTDGNKGELKRISSSIPLETVKDDLEGLRQRALDLGASMAEIIPAGWVEVDERVRLKCRVPLCGHYGKNAHCPPNGPDVELIRRVVTRFNWAVLFALDVIPVADYTDRAQQKARAGWFRKNLEIAGEVETMAFGRGYYLATAFSQGSCKAALCGEADHCGVLEGKGCAHPLKSRPSMEAVGLDVFGLATRVGWEIYPIYRGVDSKAVPRALSVGIVFVC